MALTPSNDSSRPTFGPDPYYPLVHPNTPEKTSQPDPNPTEKDQATFQPGKKRQEYQRGHEDIIPNSIEQTEPERRGLV